MTEAQSQQPKRYLDLVAGRNRVWLTSLSLDRGTPEKPRPFVKLTFAEKSSAESFDSPFTSKQLYLPLPDDKPFTRMGIDQRIKMTLFPLADVAPDTKGVKLAELIKTAKEAVDAVDVLVDLDVKLTEGKQVNSQTGEPIMFSEIVGFSIVELQPKRPFESDIDADLSDLPF